ncbi:hypothetical protein GCM10010988_40540 [Cnuibacter physcomitrellae]|uniref:hypothetical protein n=1 Tax=Cnuibacter physcomitrellae TaxID=1619308 RepID=UPI0012F50A02|nr:hypothetical protein [Cnuibacter physcomitrellae]GGI42738.1 hypothetical protein GCM10010988_40540 [Cnuibacter physcomitrellae]
MGVAIGRHQAAGGALKGFAVDRRDATSAYPDWRAQQQSVEQMYVDAGAVPPSLRIWADGVDVRDNPELWPDRYLRPHRGMRPVVWARMRRDVDGLTIGYTVDGKTADTPEEAAGLRVPEGWSLVYATLEQPHDWEPGARQVYAPGRRGGRGR